jgi:hypothetical protein
MTIIEEPYTLKPTTPSRTAGNLDTQPFNPSQAKAKTDQNG